MTVPYNLYQFYQLLESQVQLGTDFIERLTAIDHPVAKKILSMTDIENQTLPTDDDKIEAVYTAPTSSDIMVKRPGKPLNPADKLKIGRFVRKISKDFTPVEIDTFVNVYRAQSLASSFSPEIVKGKDILDVFLGENFDQHIGDLKSNCMQFGHCQPFLKIYVDNPEKVSALVARSEEGKVQARALLWNTDQGIKFMDKVYAMTPELKILFRKWADTNGYAYRTYEDNTPSLLNIYTLKGKETQGHLTVTLDSYEYDSYPFLDTFRWMSTSGVLHNEEISGEDYYELGNSTGLVTKVDYVWYIDQMAKTKEQVEEVMELCNIESYEIHDDLSVSILEDANMGYNGFKQLPVAIKDIQGYLILTFNDLRTLRGLPVRVSGDLLINGNRNLRSLEYCSKYVEGDFDINECDVQSLVGGPSVVKGEYTAVSNRLKSIEGLAANISNDLDLSEQRSNIKITVEDVKSISKVKGRIIL